MPREWLKAANQAKASIARGVLLVVVVIGLLDVGKYVKRLRKTWYWAQDLSGKGVQNVTYTGETEAQAARMKKRATRLKTMKASSSRAHVNNKNLEVCSPSSPPQDERLEELRERIRQLCWETLFVLRSDSIFNR